MSIPGAEESIGIQKMESAWLGFEASSRGVVRARRIMRSATCAPLLRSSGLRNPSILRLADQVRCEDSHTSQYNRDRASMRKTEANLLLE